MILYYTNHLALSGQQTIGAILSEPRTDGGRCEHCEHCIYGQRVETLLSVTCAASNADRKIDEVREDRLRKEEECMTN